MPPLGSGTTLARYRKRELFSPPAAPKGCRKPLPHLPLAPDADFKAAPPRPLIRRRLWITTRWTFFLCSIVASLAAVYAFLPPERIRAALGFLCVPTLIAAAYVRCSIRLTLGGLLRGASRKDWGAPIVFDKPVGRGHPAGLAWTYAAWRRGRRWAWFQRRVPRRGLGRVETVLVASLDCLPEGDVLVYPRDLSAGFEQWLSASSAAPTGDGAFDKEFVVKSTPREAASLMLDHEVRRAIASLALLDDPLHEFYVSFRNDAVTVSIQGDLEDEASARHFLDAAFRIVDKSV